MPSKFIAVDRSLISGTVAAATIALLAHCHLSNLAESAADCRWRGALGTVVAAAALFGAVGAGVSGSQLRTDALDAGAGGG